MLSRKNLREIVRALSRVPERELRCGVAAAVAGELKEINPLVSVGRFIESVEREAARN